MRFVCVDLLYYCAILYIFHSIVCSITMNFESVDLGFNNPTVDICDYVDYAESNVNHRTVDLAILQLNSRGLLGKLDKLQSLLKDVKRRQNIHVVALAETWLKSNNVNRVKIPGYKFVGSHRKCRKGGGVGFLVSQNLEFRVRKDLTLDLPGFENMTIELKTHSDSVFVSTLYRPPDGKCKVFLKNYKRLLNKFTDKELSNLIIGMDHNMDIMKHEVHPVTNEFIEHNLDKGLLPTITKPTRVTRTTATLIDNIVVGKKYQSNYESQIILSDLSDHFPCMLNIKNTKLFSKKQTTVKTRGLNPSKIEEIKLKLAQIDWDNLLANKPTDKSFDIFHQTLNDIMDETAPYHTVKISHKKIRRDPWISMGLLKCLKKQHNLYKQFLINRNDEALLQRYRTYRNKLQQVIRRAKEKYYQDKCIEYRKNTSKLWKLINKLSNKENDKTNIIEYLKIDNLDIYSSKIIAEEFAKHFSTVGKRFAEQIPLPTYSIDHYLNNISSNPKTMFMAPTTQLEIKKLVLQLANKDSSGHDNLSNRLLKEIVDPILDPLTVIFNRSITEGVFPHGMKDADVTPLHKSKEHYLVTNYRPISLLITISKLLEKVIYTRTYNFLNTTGQLYAGQYGFRSGHSCQSAISELVGTITKNMEEKKWTIGVFIDLSKAFDTLSHNILLRKLNLYGIRGVTAQWFDSYLTNRKMRIKCMTANGTTYSTYHDMDYGTPQGSCLGPLLFLVFINDLPHNIDNGISLLFADDTTLLHSHHDIETLKRIVENDVYKLMDWFRANKLTLNLSKTEVILFSSKNSTHQITLKIGTYILTNTEYVRFLGIWLDSKLQWRKHIITLLIKLKQNINMLKQCNKFLKKSTKKQIYHAHILSHVTYGLLFWGNSIDEATHNKVQKILDRSFSLCTGLDPNTTNFKTENWLTLKQLIQLETLKLGYKLDHGLLPRNIHQLLWTDSKNMSLRKTHHYDTRSRNLPSLPKALCKTYHKNFQLHCIREYMLAPVETRETNTLSNFVRKIKKLLIEKN